MHVVFVTCELATKDNSSGGLATFTANIARIFKNNGNKVEIIWVTTKETDISFDKDIIVHNLFIPFEEWCEFDYVSKLMAKNEKNSAEIRINWQNVYKAKLVSSKIKEINNEKEIDIIHFPNHCSFSLFMDRTIPFTIRISGFENIWFGGGDQTDGSLIYEDNPPAVNDIIELHAMRKTPFIMAPSNLIAEIGRNSIGKEIEVIESPFILNDTEYDESIFSEKLQNKKYILFYGTLRYLKGIHVVAHMAENFLEKYKNSHIVLAGNDMSLIDDKDGTILNASDYVKKYAGIYADRVIYIGRIVREQLYPVIKRAEFCILPSRIENLSNSCIEAMAMGKIVVATKGASYEQLIIDGKNGFLCERDNSNDFFKGAEKVLNLSEEEKKEICENAKKTVERLKAENIYEKYLRYYQKVIRQWKDKEEI